MKQTNDNKLVKSCLAGNVQSKKAFHAQFYGKMLAVCLRYIQDEKRAKDVLLDAFSQVFKNLNNYKGNKPLEAWVKHIVIRKLIEDIRTDRSNRLIVSTVHVTKKEDIYSNNNITITDLVVKASPEDLLEVLHGLISSYRLVINLSVIDKYRHAAIAEMLLISEETSISNLEKAQFTFRNKLIQHLHSNGKLDE